MNISNLRSFQITAREKSMSTAAEQLNVSQPALSRMLHLMEEEIGFQVFERHSTGIVLNENGRQFLSMTDHILQEYDETLQFLREKNGVNSNSLIISFSSSGNNMADLSYAFKKICPEVWFELRNYEHDKFDRETSFFFYSQLNSTPLNSEAIYLGGEPLFLTAGISSPYAALSSVRLRDLSSKHFLTSDRSNDMYSIQKYYCEQAGFTPMSDNIISKQHILLRLIELGMGVSILPKLYSFNVVQIPISDIDCRRHVFMEHNRNKFKTNIETRFEHFAVDYFHNVFKG